MNRRKPYISVTVLAVIIAGCVFAEIISVYDPQHMNLASISMAPSGEHLFGTDTMGRDLFAIIWYGGRISLFVGGLTTLISTVIAVIYGCLAGVAGRKTDDLLMRFAEIIMSVPQILLVIFIQAMAGEPSVVSISIVMGITGWMGMAKMVRSEVKQIRNTDYVLAARTMEGGFFYIIWNHLMPNFMPAIMFMIVTNIGAAIALEATLSFLGIGLPASVVSWGTMMSLSQRAMMSGSWWILIIPGTVLVITLICITEIGEYMRKSGSRESLI